MNNLKNNIGNKQTSKKPCNYQEWLCRLVKESNRNSKNRKYFWVENGKVPLWIELKRKLMDKKRNLKNISAERGKKMETFLKIKKYEVSKKF